METRIVVGSGDARLCEGIRALAAKERDMTVVATEPDAGAAVSTAGALLPDVAVLDLSNDAGGWREIIARLAQQVRDLRIVVLAEPSPAEKSIIRAAFHAGASGYVRRDNVGDGLVPAIRTVLANRTYVDACIAGVEVRHFWVVGDAAGSPLSQKERDVLALVAGGYTTKEIARQLDVSPKTIDAHRQSIMDKLQSRTVAGLTKYAIREGITPLVEDDPLLSPPNP